MDFQLAVTTGDLFQGIGNAREKRGLREGGLCQGEQGVLLGDLADAVVEGAVEVVPGGFDETGCGVLAIVILFPLQLAGDAIIEQLLAMVFEAFGGFDVPDGIFCAS